ncbi:arylsulfatase [Novipirellula herctigrandis]
MCAVFAALSSAPLAAKSPNVILPNVILIVSDDQGYGDVAAHGNPVLKTPNIDRLREQCVRFTDFHVAPMCSPTRGQLMTGIDAMKNGCTAVCEGRSMIRSELPTMADFFGNSGYATGHFGKWHLGDSYPHRPQDRGFQETLHHRAWGITSLADYWGNTYFDPVLEHNGVDKKYKGYCTDIFFGEAIKWIDQQTTEGKPFFLYLPTNTPHVPNVCAERYSKPYAGKSKGKLIPATFYGMIANLDENVGKLDSFLDQTRLRENTILIYMSDNGTQSKQAQAIFNAGMRNKKTSVYEGGHRVPLFVRWPKAGLIHGTDITELTQVQDLLPTLIELCDLKRSGKTLAAGDPNSDEPTAGALTLTDAKFDGTSLVDLLTGKAERLPDRKLVIQYRSSGQRWDPAVVLWGKWRLLKEQKGRRVVENKNPPELYHMGRDPGQTKNVAAEHPEIVRTMTEHYEQWHVEARKDFDRLRWITVGSKQANPVKLYSQDWTGDYCDNPAGLSRATARGYWNVIVDREADYEIELRRWPTESDKMLTEGWDGPDDKGPSARPIFKAKLDIANISRSVNLDAKATHASFTIQLPVGKTQLATTFLDSSGNDLCSAIYVTVRRLPKTDLLRP